MTQPDHDEADLDALLESVSADLRRIVAVANITASAAQSTSFPPSEDDVTATADTIAETGKRAIATLECAMRVARQVDRAYEESKK